MVPREHKRTTLHEKLQILRSVTNSQALNKTSIIVDATKYIKELKQKVESLHEDINSSQSSCVETPSIPMVTVETLQKGFVINVFSEKNSPGLFVSILEALEDLGLNVREATVSSTDAFHLEAFGDKEMKEEAEIIDAQVVKQAVVQAMHSCLDSNIA